MRQLRREAYGEDIGQHSWVTAAELRRDIALLALSSSSRVLDLGCGPGGLIGFIVKQTGCSGTGVDVSKAALAVARRRAVSLDINRRLSVCHADMNERLPLTDQAFDAVISLDVILHTRDRRQVFRDVARLLVPAGKFLFTDAGVLTGSISEAQVAARSVHGHTHFCAPGYNELMVEEAGFRILHTEDRTANLLNNAAGRLAARDTHRKELLQLEGREEFDRQRRYLETVVDLSRRGILARVMYLAETAPP
jgi:cyclopropane fatty-acyl-phospholipid synthase-like methyltransferase